MKYAERYLDLCDSRRHSKIETNGIDSKLEKLDLNEKTSKKLDQISDKYLDIDENCKTASPLHALLNNLCYQVALCEDKHNKTKTTKSDLIIIK